jgi:hypothetical protein
MHLRVMLSHGQNKARRRRLNELNNRQRTSLRQIIGGKEVGRLKQWYVST